MSGDNYIMREGERSDEMWIILEGMVKIHRRPLAHDAPEAYYNTGVVSLGKLRQFDYFGELAVLLQERPGMPLARCRSACVISTVCRLAWLAWSDVQELRRALR